MGEGATGGCNLLRLLLPTTHQLPSRTARMRLSADVGDVTAATGLPISISRLRVADTSHNGTCTTLLRTALPPGGGRLLLPCPTGGCPGHTTPLVRNVGGIPFGCPQLWGHKASSGSTIASVLPSA